MGSCQTKDSRKRTAAAAAAVVGEKRVVAGLKNKVRLLQGEINEIMCIREAEGQVYKREVMAFAFKQAEWKRDRKRLKDEVRKLRKALDDDQTRRRPAGRHRPRAKKGEEVEDEDEDVGRRLAAMGRDETTVEKWKQLYFAIKVELDDLIQRTHQSEERVCWKSEEERLVELEKEKKANEERIQLLQTKLASMEHEEYKRAREMDILRQSLRIMSHHCHSNTKSKASP